MESGGGEGHERAWIEEGGCAGSGAAEQPLNMKNITAFSQVCFPLYFCSINSNFFSFPLFNVFE